MTDNDIKLINTASQLHHSHYREIDDLIAQADTDEARRQLNDYYWLYYALTHDISD